jgi:hypothetical protein
MEEDCSDDYQAFPENQRRNDEIDGRIIDAVNDGLSGEEILAREGISPEELAYRLETLGIALDK